MAAETATADVSQETKLLTVSSAGNEAPDGYQSRLAEGKGEEGV